MHLIGPFLNEAVVFDTNELERAPRIVATQEGRVLVSRGETAYVRGDLGGARDFRVFREPQPLRDPTPRKCWATRPATSAPPSTCATASRSPAPTARPMSCRPPSDHQHAAEAGVGDRLSPVPQHDLTAYVPHAPDAPMAGQIVSIYGDGLQRRPEPDRGAQPRRARRHGARPCAGAVARRRDRHGRHAPTAKRAAMRLPDERHGLLFVFRVFERVSYALILQVQEPVRAGDRFTQP